MKLGSLHITWKFRRPRLNHRNLPRRVGEVLRAELARLLLPSLKLEAIF